VQALLIQARPSGGLERLLGAHPPAPTAQALSLQNLQAQGRVGPAAHPQAQGAATLGDRALSHPLPALFELRITGEPAGAAGPQTAQIHPPRPQLQSHTSARAPFHPHQPAADLPRWQQGVVAGHLKHHTITGLERLLGLQQQHPLGVHPLQPP